MLIVELSLKNTQLSLRTSPETTPINSSVYLVKFTYKDYTECFPLCSIILSWLSDSGTIIWLGDCNIKYQQGHGDKLLSGTVSLSIPASVQ